MKRFCCGDVVPGCAATFEAEDETILLAQVGAHARDDHGMVSIPDEVLDQVRSHMVSA